MTILAFETANFGASVALSNAQKILACDETLEERGQDGSLIPTILSIMHKNNVNFQGLRAIITTTGPGSFTGLRVGLTVAKGFSFCLRVPVLGISSLEWVAFSVFRKYGPLPSKLLIVLESRREDLFVQLFDSHAQVIKKAVNIKKSDLDQYLEGEKVLFAGNGAHHWAQNSDVMLNIQPHALDLAFQAEKILETQTIQNYPLSAFYLRSADVTLASIK